MLWDESGVPGTNMELVQMNTLSGKLGEARTVVMEPSSTQCQQQKAFKFCEEFKERGLSMSCVA